jgi:hypothetical protein
MSKFVTNNIFLANNLELFSSKKKNLQFFFLKSNKIYTLSLFFNHIIILRRTQYLLYSIIEKKKKNIIGLLYVRLLRLLFDSIAASRMSLEVLGVGYNIFYQNNFICFNVGTSNSLQWILPNNIFFKILGKKKNQLKFYTYSKKYLFDLLSSIIKLRQPNIYTGKGIYYYKLKFSTRIGKIKKI